MTHITGYNFIGGQRSGTGTVILHSMEASNGEALPALPPTWKVDWARP